MDEEMKTCDVVPTKLPVIGEKVYDPDSNSTGVIVDVDIKSDAGAIDFKLSNVTVDFGEKAIAAGIYQLQIVYIYKFERFDEVTETWRLCSAKKTVDSGCVSCDDCSTSEAPAEDIVTEEVVLGSIVYKAGYDAEKYPHVWVNLQGKWMRVINEEIIQGIMEMYEANHKPKYLVIEGYTYRKTGDKYECYVRSDQLKESGLDKEGWYPVSNNPHHIETVFKESEKVAAPIVPQRGKAVISVAKSLIEQILNTGSAKAFRPVAGAIKDIAVESVSYDAGSEVASIVISSPDLPVVAGELPGYKVLFEEIK